MALGGSQRSRGTPEMKKFLAIFTACVTVAIAAYWITYGLRTQGSRPVASGTAPELVWLRNEFHFSDPVFARICEKHEAYMPKCAHMRKEIESQTLELTRMLAATNRVTPEIKTKLEQLSRLRAECHAMMLEYVYAVSNDMPPETAKLYFAKMKRHTSLMMPSSSTRE